MPEYFSPPSFLGIPQPWINLHSPWPCRWTKIDLPIATLPQEFVGLRIIHISDAHFRAVWSDGWDRIIHRINAADADFIFMTGDFVDDKLDCQPALRCIKRFFSSLQSRFGNYAIFGNHDHDLLYQIGQQAAEDGLILPEPWPRRRRDKDGEPIGIPVPPPLPALRIFGHHLLDDRRELLQFDQATFELIGFRGTSRADFNQPFLATIPLKTENSLRIILSHHPDNIRRLEGLNADLVLSGHTHAGQICFPNGYPLMSHDSLPKNCASGLHRFAYSWLNVSRGLGFSSLPVRLFCPPEITEIQLVPGPP